MGTLKKFCFEINGFVFYFECETWEQFQTALKECGINPQNEGEMVYENYIESL
jgi:hypothetical protein